MTVGGYRQRSPSLAIIERFRPLTLWRSAKNSEQNGALRRLKQDLAAGKNDYENCAIGELE